MGFFGLLEIACGVKAEEVDIDFHYGLVQALRNFLTQLELWGSECGPSAQS